MYHTSIFLTMSVIVSLYLNNPSSPIASQNALALGSTASPQHCLSTDCLQANFQPRLIGPHSLTLLKCQLLLVPSAHHHLVFFFFFLSRCCLLASLGFDSEGDKTLTDSSIAFDSEACLNIKTLFHSKLAACVFAHKALRSHRTAQTQT